MSNEDPEPSANFNRVSGAGSLLLKGSGPKKSMTYGINDSIGIQSSNDQFSELLLDKGEGEDDGYRRIKSGSIKSNKTTKAEVRKSIAMPRKSIGSLLQPATSEVKANDQLISRIRWLRD